MKLFFLVLISVAALAALGCSSEEPPPSSNSPASNPTLTTAPSVAVQRLATPRSLPASTLKLQQSVKVGTPVLALAFTPDGQSIAVASADGQLSLYDAATGKLSRRLAGAGGEAFHFSMDGRYVYASMGSSSVSVWDAHSGARKGTIDDAHGRVAAILPKGDDSLLLIAAGNGVSLVRAFAEHATPTANASPGTEALAFNGHQGTVTSIAWAPDWTWIASGSLDHKIQIWDAAHAAVRQTLDHGAEVETVAISPDGNTVASAGRNSVVKLWDVHSGKLLRTFDSAPEGTGALVFSHAGQTLIGAGADGTVRLWPLVGDGAPQVLKGLGGAPTSLVISPDGTMIVSSGTDGTVRFWSQKTPLP